MDSTDEEIEGQEFGEAVGDVLLLGVQDTERGSKVIQRAVLTSNQVGTDLLNVPSKSVMDSRASKSWDAILAGRTGNPWQHLKDGLFGFIQSVARSAKLWPKDIIALLRTQLVLYVLLIGAAIGVTVCTAIGTFNMQMEFTYDKLIGGAYPAAPNVVGTVRLGWFIAGALWWPVLLLTIFMLIPDFYLTAYVKEQLHLRKDHVYVGIMTGMLSMFLIAALGVIGVTNVILIVLLVASFVGVFLRNHLTIPMHYANSFSVLNAIFPVVFPTVGAEEGTSTGGPAYAEKVMFSDYEGENGYGERINAQDGAAKQSSLAFSKQIVDFVAVTRENQGNPIMTDLSSEKHPTALRHYASILSHSLNTYFWAVFDEIIPAMTFIVVFMVYYATALQNDHSAFKWNVHVFFWDMFLMLLFDYIVNRYHWSNANQHPVKHSMFRGQKAIGLRLNWITLRWFQWTIWMLNFILAAIILLAPTRNLTITTLPPY